LVHAPTGGPWTFGHRPAYVAAPAGPAVDHDAALARLIRRYLEGFGPTSAEDIAQFVLHKRSTIRTALAAMDGLITVEGPGGVELVDVPGAPVPPGDTPAPPRLMAMWDSTLLAYADRRRLIPAEYRPLVVRRNGDVLPTLLVDGNVAGVWRPVDGGIEALAFHPLPSDAWAGLATEARGLHALIAGRGPAYTRYAHWWRDLPAAETRLLAG
jgi:DNA glycosylase AlkZ-like